MSTPERTQPEVVRDVFGPVDGDDRDALVRRVEMLTTLVLDLMAEVEALRQAHVQDPAYREAYRDALLLTHNSAGPTSGWQKLIGRYYPATPSDDGRVRREAMMLERLGHTPDEIRSFQRLADDMEQYT